MIPTTLMYSVYVPVNCLFQERGDAIIAENSALIHRLQQNAARLEAEKTDIVLEVIQPYCVQMIQHFSQLCACGRRN